METQNIWSIDEVAIIYLNILQFLKDLYKILQFSNAIKTLYTAIY